MDNEERDEMTVPIAIGAVALWFLILSIVSFVICGSIVPGLIGAFVSVLALYFWVNCTPSPYKDIE